MISPLANLIITSLVFIQTKIDFKTFYANSIVTPRDRSVNGVCRAGSPLNAPPLGEKTSRAYPSIESRRKHKLFYIIFNNDMKNSIKFAVILFFAILINPL